MSIISSFPELPTLPPDSPYKTRQFQERDLDQVVTINRACLPEHYPRRYFLYIYSSLPKAFRVALVNGKVVGYTMGRIVTGISCFSHFRRVKKGHTISIAVLPRYRRMGIGKRLLLESVAEMKAAGATEVYLEVRVTNQPAITMYQKLGYTIVKELKKYYMDNEAAFLMCRKI